MTSGQRNDNKTNKQNPLIDTGNVTVNAFNAIKNKEKKDPNFLLGRDDTTSFKSTNFKVKVKAWTQVDNKTHTYFHSLSIDVNVEDFMGTAELKCPYDSDLMSYWEPIRQTVVIYGANRGDYKILFIGRVRGVKQDGYELVIEFQNYGWKFKQLVTQSYANDNVLKKNGYTIMRLMFEALKIDSWVISKSAKQRLKQVGINQDGNLTLNGKEIEKMPDLLKRLEASDPSKLVNKKSLNNKLREKYLHNIEHINYTLKYEKPTKVMQKIASEGGGYSSGSNIYSNPYGSPSSATGGTVGGGVSVSSQGGANTGCTAPHVKMMGNSCQTAPSKQWWALQELWLFQRGCRNSYDDAYNSLVNFAYNYPPTYLGHLDACLGVLEGYCPRSDGRNGAKRTRQECLKQASKRQITRGVADFTRQGISFIGSTAASAYNKVSSTYTQITGHNLDNDINYWKNKFNLHW